PEADLVNFIATVNDFGRLVDLGAEFGHVARAHQAAGLFDRVAVTFGQRSAIKIVSHGFEGRVTATARVLLLYADQFAQRPRQVFLNEDVADLRLLTVRQKDGARGGPLFVDPSRVADVVHAHFVNRKGVGQFDGRLHHVGQLHRAVVV